MKKLGLYVIIAVNLLNLLTACGPEGLDNKLVVCGSYGVPGMFCFDLKGGTYACSILEEDPEGRILYEYTTYSDITQREESAIVICQYTDDQYVYFYEDQCYAVGDDRKSHMEALKERNDWGKPLDYSKISRREVHITFDLCISYDTAIRNPDGRRACAEALNTDMSRMKDLCISDVDGFGHTLYCLTAVIGGAEEHYLALFDRDCNVSLLKLGDSQPDADALAAFKRENGWVYGLEG